jgi:glycosyltransferase involved in cell wall biosynthesis
VPRTVLGSALLGGTVPGGTVPGVRVLYVINGLGTGGSERSLAEMLPRLRDEGVEPVIACLFHRPEGVHASVEAQGFDIRVLPGPRWVTRARALRQLLRATGPELVHTAIFESDTLGRWAARRTPAPVLTSLVNTSYGPARRADPNVRVWRLQAVRAVDGWTARHLTAHFHAVTAAVKAAAVEALHIPADRVAVIERGRDPERLGRPGLERRARVRAALGLADDDEVILSVGRQEYQKAQQDLLDAIAVVAARRPRAVLLIAGRDGNASAALARQHARSPAAGRIRFLGHRDDVPDLLAAADVFAFPSLYEGTGGAVIEAMGLGLPIVTSDIAAMREVVDAGRNALLVPPHAPGPLADAVLALLEDPARRLAFGARSREIFEARFTLERSTRRMVELYGRVIGG